MRSTLLAILLLCLHETGAAQSTILLVRHAEKAPATGADANDSSLSEVGRARAESLATTLRDAGITAIYATEFKRTQETAGPLARLLNLKTTVVPAKETALLVSKLKETQGNALVVAHSNTIPEIAKALGASIPFAIDQADYDNLLVLVPGSPAQLLRLHYQTPGRAVDIPR